MTGVGSGGTNVPVMALVPAWFAAKRRGFATGMAVSGSSFGMVITGLLVPVILNRWGGVGWRYSWFFLSGLAVLIAVLGYVILRNHPRDKGLSPIGVEESYDVAAVPRSSALQW